ncbi:MAG: glycosyltransferase [Candidatus Komeilibacteria bacterium]
MKIGIISNLYPPFVRGGAEIIASTLAEGLKDNLHHVFVISTQPPSGWSSWWPRARETRGVKVYRFYPWNLYYYLNDYAYPAIIRLVWHLLDIFNLHSYLAVRSVIAKEKPDMVITHNLMGIGFLIPYLLRRHGIIHIHTVHDVQLYNPSGIIIRGQENNWQQRLVNLLGYPRLMRRLLGSPKMVISPSQFLLNFYQQRGFFPRTECLQVVRNPVDFPDRALTRSTAAELRLAYVGQITEAKGILQLVDLVHRLQRTDVRLRVVGLGPKLNQALELAGQDERIQFYGWRSRQDLLEILTHTDILVMPSTCYENSPTVTLEALSLGIPVISSDIGGAAELIKPDFNGWIFEAGNWRQLDLLINKLADSRGNIGAMTTACQQSVAGFTVKNYLQRLLDCINLPAK